MTILRPCTLASLAGSLLLVVSLGGCGSSSSSSSSSSSTSTSAHTAPAPGTAAAARPIPASATQHHTAKAKLHATVYRPHAMGRLSSGTATAGTQRGRTATGVSADASTSAQNPCALVSRAEAQAIIHAQISRQIEAPQGPTCLLEVQGAKQSITLAVEAIKLPRVIAQMKKPPTRLSIGGHTAYCGTLGSSLLFVELGAGRALEVAAPCATATALAAKALPRIKA